MLELEFAELTDTGRVRVNNEDCVGHVIPQTAAQIQSQGWIFALADGVGGQEHGEVASRLAIETVLSGFRKIPKGVMHVSLLPRLVQEANIAVYDKAREKTASPGTATMATTLVLCALRFDSAVISHVGDSRCYLYRNGELGVLTRDHTLAGEQQRLGILSREEAAVVDNRHILTRSLGTELFVAADTVTVNVIPGDVLLLCSDGLHGELEDERMEEIIATVLGNGGDLNRTAQELIAEANGSGGGDNISVLLIHIRSVERMGLYRGRPYRLL